MEAAANADSHSVRSAASAATAQAKADAEYWYDHAQREKAESARLREALQHGGGRVRAVVLVSPSNPSGAVCGAALQAGAPK